METTGNGRTSVTVYSPLYRDSDGSLVDTIDKAETVSFALAYHMPDGDDRTANVTYRRAGMAEVLDATRGNKTTGREVIPYWQSDGLTVPFVYRDGTVVEEDGVGEIKATDASGNPLVRPWVEKIKGIVGDGDQRPVLDEKGEPVTVAGPVWITSLQLAIGGSIFRWFAAQNDDAPASGAKATTIRGARAYKVATENAETAALSMLATLGIDPGSEQGQMLLNQARRAVIDAKKAAVAAANDAKPNAPAVDPETLSMAGAGAEAGEKSKHKSK